MQKQSPQPSPAQVSSSPPRAQRAIALAEKELKLKDGKLEGFDDFVKAQKEADPASFAPDKPAPTITKQTGVGPKPDNGESANVAKAKEMGKARAEAAKANNDVFSQYSILKGE